MDDLITQILGTICVLFAITTGFLFAYFSRVNIIKNTDDRLYYAATFYQEILGPNYHNHIENADSYSKEEYQKQVELNNQLCKKLGLQYLWSVLSIEDQIVFTSATNSNFDDKNSNYAKFFDVHSDPNAFLPAKQKQEEPVFSTFHNEWGEGRMILISKLDKKKRLYIIGASIQLKELNELLFRSFLLSTGFGILLFLVVWFLSRILSKKIMHICSNVSHTANQIQKGHLDIEMPNFDVIEAIRLTESLDHMRNQLKIRILDLEAQNKILNQILNEKNIAEKKIRKYSEIQSILIKISSKFINISNDRINQSIELSLKELGEFVGADRAYIFDYDWEQEVSTNRYEWCAEGITSHISNLQNVHIKKTDPWSQKHLKGEVVSIEDINLFAEREENLNLLRNQGIQSLISYPLMKDSLCLGFVGFDWVRKNHNYREEDENLLSIFSNILINLRMRKDINEELAKFKKIADHSQYGKVITDISGKITYVNQFYATVHGYAPKELIGKNHSIFHSEKQINQLNLELETLKSKGKFESSLVWHSHKNGKEFPMLMTALLINDEHQKPEFIAASALDVSDLIQSQERIKNLLEKERYLNQNIQNFTFIVSHNLRIHSANMLGLLQVAKETEPELFQHEITQMLLSASQNLEETIRDLNTVLELKSANQLLKTKIDLFELVEQSIQKVLTGVPNKKVVIQNLVPKNNPVFSESVYLKSILSHIIGNAVRYHKNIENSWVKISSEMDKYLTKVIVEDNGSGIDLIRNGADLFKMYKKFHDSPDSKGLGLYITQIQVEALGGSIEVQSEIGEGSKFTVSIPNESYE
ncbi:MAG: PAS domain S-box protein [Leptospira sp.]|nr:PAS domain S-box protein [Leptospira sp.]